MTINSIGSRINKTPTTLVANSLVRYFKENGLEVIDKRGSGGCLGAIGDEKELKLYTDEVKSKFGAYGYFGAGKAKVSVEDGLQGVRSKRKRLSIHRK